MFPLGMSNEISHVSSVRFLTLKLGMLVLAAGKIVAKRFDKDLIIEAVKGP